MSNAVRDVFVSHEDYEPVFGKTYFKKDAPASKGFHKITVLIPMYNESSTEFKRTLGDLHACIAEMNKIGAGHVHILTILDGWNATHPTIKDYLKVLFPGVSSDIDNISNSTKSIDTFVIQKLDGDEATYVQLNDKMSLKLSVLVKLDNRRKHNSHAWFLETFAQEMDSDFIFLTDCGTRFDHKCLINLYRGISTDKMCSAISGRQRVMSTEQQGSTDTFRGFMYRSMQRFDYEASLASYVGAFSTFGMLPVIPGPCGMYRLSAICNKKKRDALRAKTSIVDASQFNAQEAKADGVVVVKINDDLHDSKEDYIDAIDFYIKTVSLNPDETGMLLGSLLLAEDRILSYAAVLKTEERFHTKYEPSSCFYFEAETVPTTLLQQRRRWINGTIAGYIWLLQHISLLFNSKISLLNKIVLTLLVFSQLMMFCVMTIGVAILSVAIRYPLKLAGMSTLYVESIIGAYVLLYVVFVFLHSSPTRKGPKLNVVLFDIITLVNVGVAGLMMYGFALNVMNYKLIVNIAIIGFNMVMPFLLALCHDLTSLRLMIGSVVQYALLLPTFTVTLSVYSFSRLYELTWGNRPSFSLVTLKKTKSEAELAQIKKDLHNNAQSVAWCLVVLNIVAVVAFSLLEKNKLFIVILQAFIFVWSSLQMLFSLMYFIAIGIKRTLKLFARMLCVCSTSRKALDIKKKKRETEKETFKVVVETIKAEMNNNVAKA